MSTPGKYKHLIQQILGTKTGKTLIICHFEQTAAEINQLLNAADISDSKILMSPEVNHQILSGYVQKIIAELHPLKANNDTLRDVLPEADRDKIAQLVSLDEVALKPFQSHRIIDLMLKMGVNEDEPIAHTLVQKSINQALDKWNERLKSPQEIRSSQADWEAANLS